MLPSLYQTHLENQLESSELLFLELLVEVLQNIKEVSLEKIATVLPLPILFESRRKKVQRFLSLPSLNIETLWFPIIKNWLAESFPKNQPIYLVIDRTIWERKNLMLIYGDEIMDITSEMLDQDFKDSFREIVHQVSSCEAPRKVPSLRECQYCKINSEYCSQRIELQQVDDDTKHDIF
jgi:hypothetical protein